VFWQDHLFSDWRFTLLACTRICSHFFAQPPSFFPKRPWISWASQILELCLLDECCRTTTLEEYSPGDKSQNTLEQCKYQWIWFIQSSSWICKPIYYVSLPYNNRIDHPTWLRIGHFRHNVGKKRLSLFMSSGFVDDEGRWRWT
jgi:hypothetical protein